MGISDSTLHSLPLCAILPAIRGPRIGGHSQALSSNRSFILLEMPQEVAKMLVEVGESAVWDSKTFRFRGRKSRL